MVPARSAASCSRTVYSWRAGVVVKPGSFSKNVRSVTLH
jgi:hypothetical protein